MKRPSRFWLQMRWEALQSTWELLEGLGFSSVLLWRGR